MFEHFRECSQLVVPRSDLLIAGLWARELKPN
jgi:hypothetical protein